MIGSDRLPSEEGGNTGESVSADTKVSSCTYCGTSCTERDGELYSDGRLHTAGVCREYVYGALRATQRELDRLEPYVDFVHEMAKSEHDEMCDAAEGEYPEECSCGVTDADMIRLRYPVSRKEPCR